MAKYLSPPAPVVATPALVAPRRRRRRRSVISHRTGWWTLLRSLLRQWWVERSLRARARCIRLTEPAAVREAYEALSSDEFDAINGPQRWTHARVIPRIVAGLLPDRPSVVVDLGCGSGDSTEWLARGAAPRSLVLGYDFSRRRLASARARRYLHRDGSVARTEFVCQPIDERLRDADGNALPAACIDLAYSSGVVGHHLEPRAVGLLADELRRVVRPGGAVVLDAGPRLGRAQLTRILCERGFERVASHQLGPFNSRAQLVCRAPLRDASVARA